MFWNKFINFFQLFTKVPYPLTIIQSVGDKEVADKGFKPLLKVKYPKRHGRRFHIVKEDKSEHNNKF